MKNTLFLLFALFWGGTACGQISTDSVGYLLATNLVIGKWKLRETRIDFRIRYLDDAKPQIENGTT